MTKNKNTTYDTAAKILLQFGAEKGGDMVDGILQVSGFDSFSQLCEAEIKKNGFHMEIITVTAIYYHNDLDEEHKALIKLAYQEVA